MNILEKFFGTDGAKEFLRDSWPSEAYIQDGDLARLDDVGRIPEFHDIKLLLRNLPGHVDLVCRDGKRVIVPQPLDALPAYCAGTAMLYLKELEAFPAVARACDELASLLVIPRHFVSCEGFAAIGAVDVPLHFDHETNFMVQVRGDKTWVFAKNTDLPNPTFPYFPSHRNRYYDDGRNPFTGAWLPSELPTSHVERVVYAGTVTFMPHGYWHRTRTQEESFAIGFVINPPTLAEIALSALLARLHSDTGFRAHPLTANTTAGRAQLVQRLRELVGATSNGMEGLLPEVLLDDYLSGSPGNSRPLNHPR